MNPAEEVWRDIEGWPYAVSSLGRVKRTAPGRGTYEGRIKTPVLDSGGYPMVSFYGGVRSWGSIKVHHLVARAFLGVKPTDLHEVNHINGIKTDNRAANLEWVTRSENALHAFRLGLRVPLGIGDDHPSAKLTEDDVEDIRERYRSENITQAALAAEFHVSFQQISKIVRGENWTHTLDKDAA